MEEGGRALGVELGLLNSNKKLYMGSPHVQKHCDLK